MKKVTIKITFSDEDRVKRMKKFSRQVIGSVPPTKVEKPKKGGGYKRRPKHQKPLIQD